MAAPRKYSDSQRTEMIRLYEAGKNPAEIARMCGEGKAGVEQFQVPRRTVHEIVTKAIADAEQELPQSMEDAGSAEALHRFPERICRILAAEIERLETKQRSRPLSPSDFDCLQKAAALSKRLVQQGQHSSTTATGNGRRNGSRKRQEGLIDRMARKQAEAAAGEEANPSVTHTLPEQPDPPVPAAPERPSERPQHDFDEARAIAARHGVADAWDAGICEAERKKRSESPPASPKPQNPAEAARRLLAEEASSG